MSESIEHLISDFLDRGWDSNPFDRTLAIVRDTPEQIPTLLRAVMRDIPKGGTLFDAAISYLLLDDFPALVDDAVLVLGDGENEAAESFIAYTALQFPAAAHPHLKTLFSLAPNSGSYYENWPWRESGTAESEFLVEQISNESGGRQKAWECLLETRDSTNLGTVKATYESIGLPHPFSAYVLDAGFTSDLRQLYSTDCMHLVFPTGYFTDDSSPSWLQKHHPTWSLESAGSASARFGGSIERECGVCGGNLHRLVTLDAALLAPETRIGVMTLATCLSCLGWEQPQLFFRHDNQGQPRSVGYEGARKVPEFPAAAFQETDVKLVPTPRRWYWQDWALSNSRENLHRLLGYPSWIQSAEYPECPLCEETMRFIMQLDSDLPTEDGGEWLWGSGGIGYVFWCESCTVSGFLWQCT
jgi:hypothetical protein